MGTDVTVAAFAGVEDVPGALGRAEAVLRDAGIVQGVHDPEAVLAWRKGLVLRPGPKAAQATAYGQSLLSLRTNGVAFHGDRYFYGYGIGFAEWFLCPACGGRVGTAHGRYADQMSHIGMAAMHWSEGQDGVQAACVSCGAASDVRAWRISDPVFMADMAVEFWNWPYLADTAEARAQWWHVDVVPMLEAAIGAPAMVSGHKI